MEAINIKEETKEEAKYDSSSSEEVDETIGYFKIFLKGTENANRYANIIILSELFLNFIVRRSIC